VAVIVLAVMAGVVGAVVSIRRNEARRRALASTTTALEVDSKGVTREMADGRREVIAWDHVREVEVITTTIGPHKEDGVLLVLGGDETEGCLVPSRLAVEHGVIEALHRLPGFDGRRLVEAMEVPPPSRTTCWARERE
jgi:hypothetical protein